MVSWMGNLMRRLLIALVKGYRLLLSPWLGGGARRTAAAVRTRGSAEIGRAHV